jgi:hypothetical protein
MEKENRRQMEEDKGTKAIKEIKKGVNGRRQRKKKFPVEF